MSGTSILARKKLRLASHIMRKTQNGEWLVQLLMDEASCGGKNSIEAIKTLLNYSVGAPEKHISITGVVDHNHHLAQVREMSDTDLAQMEAIYARPKQVVVEAKAQKILPAPTKAPDRTQLALQRLKIQRSS